MSCIFYKDLNLPKEVYNFYFCLHSLASFAFFWTSPIVNLLKYCITVLPKHIDSLRAFP